MTEQKKNISIIYYQKNDSPKYLEINKKRFILFLVGLPTITLIALTLGALGLLQTSPFHLLDIYRQNTKARLAISSNQEIQDKLTSLSKSNLALVLELETLRRTPPTTTSSTMPESTQGNLLPACKESATPSISSTIGLSTLSYFKPIQGQKDKTRPASLNLTGFQTISSKEVLHLQFNIINLLGNDIKLAGQIIVLMKNNLMIQAYPAQSLATNDHQINFAAGEPFATQRFRPVDAIFSHPKRAGSYIFTIFIFAKNGDLMHFQNVTLPVIL